MMVLNEKCKLCNCICNVKHFQKNFLNWTSGNNDIDKFIQDAQLSAHKDLKKALEWIHYDRLYNIICTENKMYRANWIDGNLINWNNKTQSWEREFQNMIVELEVLSNSENITLELIDKV
jgi:hypothetical protein